MTRYCTNCGEAGTLASCSNCGGALGEVSPTGKAGVVNTIPQPFTSPAQPVETKRKRVGETRGRVPLMAWDATSGTPSDLWRLIALEIGDAAGSGELLSDPRVRDCSGNGSSTEFPTPSHHMLTSGPRTAPETSSATLT
jgi:hypothetical protein